MPIGAVVGTVGAAAIGASAQAKAAKKGAQAVSDASDRATELNREIYYDQRGLLAPSITAGASARARQMLMQGFSPEEVKAYLASTASALASPVGAGEAQPAASTQGGGVLERLRGGWGNIFGAEPVGPGPSTSTPTTINATPGEDYSWVDDWSYTSASPSYDFRFDEGQRALERSAAARGDLFSGGTGRELTRYGQDFASTEFENDWRRLGQLAGDGTQATGTVVNVAGNYGQQAGSNIMAAGRARASGYQQAGDAWGNFWGDTIPGAIGTTWGYGQKNWGWG